MPPHHGAKLEERDDIRRCHPLSRLLGILLVNSGDNPGLRGDPLLLGDTKLKEAGDSTGEAGVDGQQDVVSRKYSAYSLNQRSWLSAYALACFLKLLS